jgi:peptidoglycan/xylan/chitin deacetylase (PgdA/CDA1 family)
MDNPYYDWSPLPGRPPLRWPEGARVALCVIVCIEQIEWLPPEDAVVPPSAVRFGPYPAVLDVHEISHHEYGNRVGIFRVMDVLDRHGIRATAAIDALSAEGNPFVVRRCVDRGWELAGHGVSFGRLITERMTEAEERAYIRRSLDAVRKAGGAEVRGWLSPDYGESTRTVRLLAELGVRYVCDWPNDEQPYRMKVPSGEMVSLPVTLDLDEVHTHRERGISMQRWLQIVKESFDRLYRDGAVSGRLVVLNLHPYLIGQPFRIRYLDEALRHMLRRKRVWAATAGEVAEWYAANAPS